ncbi:protein FAM8A1-like [Branchiostoma lanceolatum]|uniref:protein FAM8A1-like n=1 Tax=Branchiostoma lanceolatum TaxID=7740 RepID=UPI0034562B82
MASTDNPFESLRQRRPDSDKFKASPGHILGRKDTSKSRESSERTSNAPQQSSKEYTVSVHRWLAEYWHHVAYWNTVHNTMAMPMWCVGGGPGHGQVVAGQQAAQTELTAARVPAVTAPSPVLMNAGGAQELRQQQLQAGKEYSVPAVSRRLMAEFLDFLILFLMKLLVTLTMMHFYEGLDPTKFDIRVVLEEMDDDASLQDLQNMLVSAIIYRLCVTVFEAVFLRGSEAGMGGATPGKWMMGLQVVSCDYVLPATNGNVRVVPAGHMGFGRSIVRALIKNLSIALFFPICFTVFIFQYNRTAYDVIAGSMVVAKPTRARRNE